nr:MAG TPA: hypothetical protein [Caudoviricetes sp.]
MNITQFPKKGKKNNRISAILLFCTCTFPFICTFVKGNQR